MFKGASISPCGLYRWRLWRKWENGEGLILWVMLNPSTADAENDDPTIRRLIGFSKLWGYQELMVVNLYALRATNPKELLVAEDPVGTLNNLWLHSVLIPRPRMVIAAWGNNVRLKCNGPFKRDKEVLSILTWHNDVYHLGLTQKGCPKHPLYLPSSTEPVLWVQKREDIRGS
jgi:hypothetical protein